MKRFDLRRAVDAIEWAAIDKENGFRHLRAGAFKGNAHGLFPVWNGVALNARAAKAGDK